MKNMSLDRSSEALFSDNKSEAIPVNNGETSDLLPMGSTEGEL